MSHFVTLVLCAKTDPIETVETLLEPYDENTRVAPYEVRCECVGSTARHRVAEAANAKFGTYDDLRRRFHETEEVKYAGARARQSELLTASRARTDEETTELRRLQYEQQARWQAFFAPRDAFEREQFEADPDHATASPECPDCHGTATRSSTYNPKSKWDWFQIGGRWDGYLRELLPHNADPEAQANVVPVRELLDHWRPAMAPLALVTPDGAWHERGRMGWFGSISDEQDPDAWEKQVRELLEKYPDHDAVTVDCHI